MTMKPNKQNAALEKLSPKQVLFINFYLNPKEPETFGSARASALKAGFSEYYANILISKMPGWLKPFVRYGKMVQKAERNLDEFLDMDTLNDVATKYGVITQVDSSREKTKLDATKFALERLNKPVFAQKTEVQHSGEIKTISQLLDSLEGKTIIDGSTIEGQDVEGEPPVSDQDEGSEAGAVQAELSPAALF